MWITEGAPATTPLSPGRYSGWRKRFVVAGCASFPSAGREWSFAPPLLLFPPNPLALDFGGIWDLAQSDIPGSVSV